MLLFYSISKNTFALQKKIHFNYTTKRHITYETTTTFSINFYYFVFAQ